MRRTLRLAQFLPQLLIGAWVAVIAVYVAQQLQQPLKRLPIASPMALYAVGSTFLQVIQRPA